MNSYRHLIYMILDQVKGSSDDFNFNENHIVYLVNKIRAFLLEQKYKNKPNEISEENFQELCLELEPYYNDCNKPEYLKSTKTIPTTLIIQPKIYLDSFMDNSLSMVSSERFSVAGSSKYSGNTLYASIGKDRYLYIKSNNPQFINLREIKLSGIFTDPLKVSEYKCNACECKDEGNTTESTESSCDPLDTTVPIEEALIMPIIQSIVQEVFRANTNLEDDTNNSTDDIPNKMAILSAMLRNRGNDNNHRQNKQNNG